MRKNFVPKYRYYTNGENVVVAVASYKGRTIRGVAKCSEQKEAGGRPMCNEDCERACEVY